MEYEPLVNCPWGESTQYFLYVRIFVIYELFNFSISVDSCGLTVDRGYFQAPKVSSLPRAPRMPCRDIVSVLDCGAALCHVALETWVCFPCHIITR